MRLTLLSALLCAIAAVAAEPKPSTVGSHVWDSAALARWSSPYKREIVADPQARSGRAVRFTGSAGFISMHDELRIAPGRSRFTIRLRLEKGGHFATDFEARGRGFQSRAPIEFADLPADGSFTERVVKLNLPGPLNVVSLRGGSWHARRQVDLRTRFRGIGDPRIRFDDFGFGCVLACEDTTPAEWHQAPGANPASRRQHIQSL